MISGLLKLMCRLSFAAYQADFEVPFRTYFITDDNPASRKIERARFHPGTFLLVLKNSRAREDVPRGPSH
jgi:hypothetical protein